MDSHWPTFYTKDLAPHATDPDYKITYDGEEGCADHSPDRLAARTLWEYPRPLIFYIESKMRATSFFTADMDESVEDDPDDSWY